MHRPTVGQNETGWPNAGAIRLLLGRGGPPGRTPGRTEVRYLFSVVGISRCDVRAACSGATPSNAIAARIFVPPATTRAGKAQRAIPTITLNTYVCEAPAAARPKSPTRPASATWWVCDHSRAPLATDWTVGWATHGSPSPRPSPLG